ncbi:hypothetical protein K3495_g4143 [Podosphaera aphanis]|nr:hypothetical protein K3495_g4143 [Podosphaera aphanis]
MEFTPEPGIFRHPRPKKALLPPQVKKRKIEHKIEEISFDFTSREEYLTGFHKRKVARVKAAQAEALKKSREERIIMRKKLREDRKKTLDLHVEAMNSVLQDFNGCSDKESDHEDFQDDSRSDINFLRDLVDHEDEYIDEEKYTSVTVEEVDVSKMGLSKVLDHDKNTEEDRDSLKIENTRVDVTKKQTSKPRKKFRYESKIERKLDRAKQKVSKRKRADARKSK